MDDRARPYLTAALLCERVLQEVNGTLSAIRIIDKVEFEARNLPAGMKPSIQLTGLVSLKSGPAVGEFTLSVRAINPKGESKELYSGPIKLLGNDNGGNLILMLTLAIENEGLHWFDVLVDGEILSRIPLMLVRKQQVPTET